MCRTWTLVMGAALAGLFVPSTMRISVALILEMCPVTMTHPRISLNMRSPRAAVNLARHAPEAPTAPACLTPCSQPEER